MHELLQPHTPSRGSCGAVRVQGTGKGVGGGLEGTKGWTGTGLGGMGAGEGWSDGMEGKAHAHVA